MQAPQTTPQILVILSSPRRNTWNTLKPFPRAFPVLEFSFRGSRRPAARDRPWRPIDPDFDRRDVYLITQNALADSTYLNYIRAHYNRSTQVDSPFFQEMFRSRNEKEANVTTNLLARMVGPLDRFFTSYGKKVEDRSNSTSWEIERAGGVSGTRFVVCAELACLHDESCHFGRLFFPIQSVA